MIHWEASVFTLPESQQSPLPCARSSGEEALKEIPANSVEGLLQGRAAGLQVINSSQDPGAGATVRIRGGSSLRGSNAPLVVVDGFPLGDAGDLKQINPSDIVNMEILKDASASAKEALV